MDTKLAEEVGKYIASFAKDMQSIVIEKQKPKRARIADHTEAARQYFREFKSRRSEKQPTEAR